MKKLLINILLCVFSLSLYSQTTIKVGDIIITIPSVAVDSVGLDSLGQDLEVVKDEVKGIIQQAKELDGWKSWLLFILSILGKAMMPTGVAIFTRATRIYKRFQQLFKDTATIPIVFALGLAMGAGLELLQSGFANFSFNDWADNSFLTVAGAVAFYEFIIKKFFGESPKRETL